jgi:hypothetical protein
VFVILFATNKSDREIAHELKISKRALRDRLLRMYEKFNYQGEITNRFNSLNEFLGKRYQEKEESIPEHLLKKIIEAEERQLQELDLSNNWNSSDDRKLTKIPERIFKLSQLRYLNLNYNNLNNPESISNLTNLTKLTLSDTPLQLPPIRIAKQGIKEIKQYFI